MKGYVAVEVSAKAAPSVILLKGTVVITANKGTSSNHLSMTDVQLYETETHQKRGDDQPDQDPCRERPWLILEMLVEHGNQGSLQGSES